jgi:Tfp pilus assembly protein PilF
MLTRLFFNAFVVVDATTVSADTTQECIQSTDLDLRARACTILIDRGGNVAWAYTNRGSTHLAKKVSERAISDLNKAIKLDPNYVLAYD